ncbi:gfo/Idh/MocA family oxidoreductase [bacterium]|nr:MAG: gfo/Idh/MocA family oxidoreductase [bacterium]
MVPFRIGLAGAGRMGRNHMAAIAASEHVAVTAIAEPVEATRQEMADSGAKVYDSLESMVNAGGIDGVIVCVPSDQHLQTVRRLVGARLPILCEKPLGVSAAEAREASGLAEQARIPLQIGFWRRFVPSLRRLRARIEQGELGEIYQVGCYQWDGVPPGVAFRAHSGGIFIDMGVHEFDQARWLTGQEFESVEAMDSGVALEPWPGDPESAQALGRMSGGSTTIVSLGRRFPLGDVCKVEVHGTRDWEEVRFLWPPDADAVFMAALRNQAESFAHYARGGSLQGAGGRDVTEAVVAAESAAAASGKS